LHQIQQSDPNNPQPPQQKHAADELKQAIDNQANAGAQLNQSDASAAKQSQDSAAQHLEKALQALSQSNQTNQQKQQQKNKQGQAQQSQEPNQPAKVKQPSEKQDKTVSAQDATAEEILNKEQQGKKQRQILERRAYQKVEKDW